MLFVIRRQIIPAVMVTVILAVAFGLIYPLLVTGIGAVFMSSKANGSFVTDSKGNAVASKLIGQNFLDAKGNPDPLYFQPRPSAAGAGYDPTSSSGSNLGPADPRLVGFQPGLNTVGLDGNPSATNVFATKDDPFCVPTDATSGAAVISPAAGQKYAMNPDGSYVCSSSTVPQRAIAYRQLNSMAADAKVPVDALTASASGLEAGISVANANLQAARVADARKVALGTVTARIAKNTTSRPLGILGEATVNVVTLNLALDKG